MANDRLLTVPPTYTKTFVSHLLKIVVILFWRSVQNYKKIKSKHDIGVANALKSIKINTVMQYFGQTACLKSSLLRAYISFLPNFT